VVRGERIDARNGRAGELDPVDLDALARQLVGQRGDQVRRALSPVLAISAQGG
jgi:hypothetical protein